MRNTGTSAASVVAVFLMVLAVAAVSWIVRQPGDHEWGWRVFLISLPAIFGGIVLLRHGAKGPVDQVPDLLARAVGRYFERDGLCFAPLLSVSDGLCRFNVCYQNRYSHGCRGTLFFIPMEGMCESGSHEVPPIIADVECGGGEVGVVSVPYPIAAKRQGKLMVYDVFAKVEYPAECGEVLRTPEGRAVGDPPAALARVMRTTGPLAIGVVKVSGGASCELRLPEHVTYTQLEGAEQFRQTLWEPDLPTGGFPVSSHGTPE